MTEPASPAEPAAATPSPQAPVLWPVLRQMFLLLRRHGLRIAVFTVVIVLSTSVITWALNTFQYWCAYSRIEGELMTYYVPVALWAVLRVVWGPLEAGYFLALHRLLGGEDAGVRTLVVGYRSRRLFWRLVAGAFVFIACRQALCELWNRLPWDFFWAYFGNVVPPDSPLFELLLKIPAVGWFVSEIHLAAQTLILLPLQWMLVEIIVAGKSWPKALAGSASLAWRHKRLALVFLAVEMVLSFDVWLRELLPHARDYVQDHSDLVFHLVDSAQLAGNTAITCAITAIDVAALVVVYRAMRASDAVAQPPESA